MIRDKENAEAIRLDIDIYGYSHVGPFATKEQCRGFIESMWPLQPQYDGELTYHVRSTPEYADLPVSKGRSHIGPHTEGIALESSPRYLGLYCMKQATCGGGHTSLYDGYRILESLPTEKLEVCYQTVLQFCTSGRMGQERASRKARRMVQLGECGSAQISFSDNYFRWGDLNPVDLSGQAVGASMSVLSDIVCSILDGCKVNRTDILIPNNCVLIWDNYRMLHSRTGFTDLSRHLIRYWMGHAL